MKYIYLLLTMFIYIQLSTCKSVVKTLKYNDLIQQNWHYITKFQSDIGNTSYRVSLKFLTPISILANQIMNLRFEVYLDDDWNDNAEYLPECQRNTQSKINTEINLPISVYQSQQEFIVEGSLNQNYKPHVWFFAISDCDGQFLQKFPQYTDIKLEITVHLKNDDDSEFSMEDKGSLQWVGLLCFIQILILLCNLNYCVNDFKRNEEYDWPFIILIMVLAFETIQNIFFLIHLYVYSFNGSGVIILQILSEFLQILSNFSLSSLLIMISWGWSIRYIEFNKFKSYIPIGICVAILQLVVMGLGKLNDDMHHKYHPYDSWVGYIISIIELGLFGYFYKGILNNQNSSCQQVIQFVRSLTVYGSLYFLGFPFLFLVSKLIVKYLRYKLIMIGTNTLRFIAILSLQRLFTSKCSDYSEISYKNKSFIDRSKLQ